MINKKALKILSDGLLELTLPIFPIEGVKFDMDLYSDDSFMLTRCGTAGCAVGWAPFFGIKKLAEENFVDYRNRVFDTNSSVTSWLFASSWSSIDNTKRGAGLRIKYYLEHGLPKNWENQMLGIDPLTYLKDD